MGYTWFPQFLENIAAAVLFPQPPPRLHTWKYKILHLSHGHNSKQRVRHKHSETPAPARANYPLMDFVVLIQILPQNPRQHTTGQGRRHDLSVFDEKHIGDSPLCDFASGIQKDRFLNSLGFCPAFFQNTVSVI